MYHMQRAHRLRMLVAMAVLAVAKIAFAQSDAKPSHDHGAFPCTDDGLKSSDVGCLLLGKLSLGRGPDAPLFWHVNRFSSRGAAEAGKAQNAMVVEAEGAFWLFTFGPKNAAPRRGEFVASIGPLPLTSDRLPPGKTYDVVAYLAVMPPAAHTRVHTHPGPEAWYVLAGEQCLETPEGTIRARRGQAAVVRPSIAMHLTNSGSSMRRALFIVIHDSTQPWSIVTDEWKPTGACDR